MRETLEPVRRALLEASETEAEQLVTDASQKAADEIDAATAEGDAAVEHARERAALSAQAHADQEVARVRAENHGVVLDAREQLRHRLIDTVHVAALELRQDPRYSALLDRLETLARDQLGHDTTVDRDPESGGGITASAGSRQVDYRLTKLADRALDELADEVAALWA